MQWLRDPNQSNENCLNNVRREDSIHFGNKRKTYLDANIVELEVNSKIKIPETCTGASVT